MHLPALLCLFVSWFDGINEEQPLHKAAYSGNIVQAHFALLRCPDAVNEPRKWGKGDYPSPVHIAAERNRVGVLKLLIARGGNIHDRGKGVATPLQLAAAWGSTDTAELLLKYGVTLDVFSAVSLNKWNEVKFMFAVAKRLGFEKKLANASTSVWGSFTITLLDWAVLAGHYRMAELLIFYGAAVNPEFTWVLPLQESLAKGRYDLAELLIQNGADLNEKDNDGYTALHRAVEREDVRAARYLLKRGASTDIDQRFRRSRDGTLSAVLNLHIPFTPLHLAVEGESPELVALLLASGASLTARNTARQNPLDIAMRAALHREPSPERELCIKLLLRYGGKPTEPQK
jgi:ankyrin repeat protein